MYSCLIKCFRILTPFQHLPIEYDSRGVVIRTSWIEISEVKYGIFTGPEKSSVIPMSIQTFVSFLIGFHIFLQNYDWVRILKNKATTYDFTLI